MGNDPLGARHLCLYLCVVNVLGAVIINLDISEIHEDSLFWSTSGKSLHDSQQQQLLL